MHNLTEIRENIKQDYADYHSWRTVGDMYGLQPSMARMIARGYQPGAKVRAALGLPPLATVIVMTEGEIPPDTQVITATRCACGRWYVSNHPARKRCFICSPYGGRK